MPSLFRLLAAVGLIAALVYGAMLALVTFVHVQPREIVQPVAIPKSSPIPSPSPAAKP